MASIKNIKKSNKYQTVDYSDFSHKEYQNLLHSGSKVEPRKKAAQELLNYLCDKYGIPRCPIFVFFTTYDPKFEFTYMGLYQGAKDYLRLPDSVHCKGFESRIRDLRRKLAS